MRELWRMVAPRGALAVTTWGPEVLEPGPFAFWAAVRAVRPDLVGAFNPWDDLVEPAQLVELYAAGIGGAEAELVDARQPLAAPDEWWDVVMGSGFRGTVEQLTFAEREHVRAANLDVVAGLTSVHTRAVHGVATKR